MPLKKEVDLNKLFQNSVYNSVISLLTIGAYIALFFTLTEIFKNYHVFELIIKVLSPILNLLKLDSSLITAIFEGLIEITKGTYSVAQISANLQIKTIICCFLISFGGLSIFFQSISFLNIFKINKRFYFLQKITHALFSLFICYFLTIAFNLI